MAKVTSKLQVTIPKKIADGYDIRPGDEIDWVPAGESIRVLPAGERPSGRDPRRRLELFDQASTRQHSRGATASHPAPGDGRGWTREGLYERGRAR